MQNQSMAVRSTLGVAESDRTHQWKDYLATYIDNMSEKHKPSEHVFCEPLGKEIFSGQLESGELGCLKINRVKTSPHRFQRKKNTSAEFLTSPLILIVQLSGVCSITGMNNSKYLEPGSMMVFDTRNAFDISNIEYSDQLLVTIPRNSVAMADGVIHTYGNRFDCQNGLGKLLYDLLKQSIDSYELLNTASKMSIAQSVLHLMPNILTPSYSGTEVYLGSSGIMIQGIKSYIEKNLSDPYLAIEKIAEENHCSVRTIHRLFKINDIGSVSHYIWNRRIVSAAEMLIDPGYLTHSITDIAFNCGFSSSTHFSRVFKSCYGMTPRQYRSSISLINQ